MWLDWMTIIIMWRHQSYAGSHSHRRRWWTNHVDDCFQQKNKKMTFCAFMVSSRDQVSVLCHLPSSRDHVDIHKQVKLCPLVPSGAVKYILHVSKRPCRQNKLQLFEKIRQNFVYVMWLGSKCYVIVNDVVIVLLYITL